MLDGYNSETERGHKSAGPETKVSGPLLFVAGEKNRRELLAKPDARLCVRTEATGQRVLNINLSLRRILFRTGADSSHPHK